LPSSAPPPPPGVALVGADNPPPPTAPGAAPSDGKKKATDNPIAVAGLMVSVLGLVLAIIVLGFFFGLIGVVLSVIARRRAKAGLGGSGLALAGLLLGLLAMVLSVASFFLILSWIDSGDETVVNGIATTSTNTVDPPQDDLDTTVCGASNSGRLATASVRITNRSESSSVYRIEVEWLDDEGETVSSTVVTDYVGVDESLTVDFVELTGAALPDSCRVVQIDRSSLPLF
jgi:hypothetical protein